MLAMIIPGGIIIATILVITVLNISQTDIIRYCGCNVDVNDEVDLLQCAVLLSAAYIIGLINNWINDGFFRGFRNNRNAIENELIKVLKNNELLNLKNSGILLINKDYRKVKNLKTIIKEVTKEIFKNVFCKHKRDVNPPVYYAVYYKLAEKKLIGTVAFIESQVSLLRNSILPLFILTIVLFIQNWKWAIGTVILAIFSYVVMIQRQNKIYQIIWESANYYKI